MNSTSQPQPPELSSHMRFVAESRLTIGGRHLEPGDVVTLSRETGECVVHGSMAADLAHLERVLMTGEMRSLDHEYAPATQADSRRGLRLLK